MCHRVRCRQCGKPTWAGCGAHVEQALAGVQREARCRCREDGRETNQAPERPARPRRLFGLF
jgi:hypothetical protein